MMLTIQNLSYIHPNKELLFSNINLTVQSGEKIALIGNNGTGKSTFLKVMAGFLAPADGILNSETKPYYVPQVFGQYNHLTVAEALGVGKKLRALQEILNGRVLQEHYDLLNDDWTIAERCQEALNEWKLTALDLSQKMGTLSGGQKTKVFLAGISVHQPALILLDEPTNHLDMIGRQVLYSFIQNTKKTLVIVSHDRKLLHLLSPIGEFNKNGITMYGGNYDFYVAQKQLETNALTQGVHGKEKALKNAEKKERETMERKQKADIRAKKNVGKAGLPKIVANTWKNSAERSATKVAHVHAEKIGSIKQELQDLRSSLSQIDQMKFHFDHANLHKGKKLFVGNRINIYHKTRRSLWNKHLDVEIVSGERIAIKGANGAGKTTLIQLILGNISPSVGGIHRAENQSVYVDQDYSLINDDLCIYEQAQQFNRSALQEHEVKTRLNRFLFSKDDWDKACRVLSGGERMRLLLCCLSIGNQSPDIIVLDEPTNNLDILNSEILTNAINDYRGTLLVISHDETFLEQINIERVISL